VAFSAKKLVRKGYQFNNSCALKEGGLPITCLLTNALDAPKSQTVDGQSPRI